eukprot:303471-Pelagomonas_calceolata.AAC.4
MVKSHFKELNADASPGFDGTPSPILRHLKHAAKKLKTPQQSPRLHAAFIVFSQSYDTVPRLQPWGHLQHVAMSALLLQEIKEMYKDDEYIII